MKRAVLGIAVLCLLSAGCDRREEVLISGWTMGTTYHVKLVLSDADAIHELKQAVQDTLDRINRSMSTYSKESEISRFNAIDDTRRRLAISDDFYRVMLAAKQIYEISEGAWDGTLAPIVDLWGFGPSGRSNSVPSIPSASDIEAQLVHVGFNQIDISDDRTIRKKNPRVTLDLNSIAKGYAADCIAAVLTASGVDNLLAEVGGETVARGARMDGGPWRVGINVPRPDAPVDSIYRTLTLTDKGLATSGDYRNFFEIDGVRYSHVFNPRTGYPVSSGIVSVSVVAPTCVVADGLATALMVLGADRALALVNALAEAECMLVVSDSDGRLTDYFSKGFPAAE